MFRIASRFISAWPLVAKRALVHWKALSSVIAGVLLASAIMASTVVYLDALRDLALKHALNQRTDDQLDILGEVELRLSSRFDYESATAVATREFDRQLGWLVDGRVSAVKTSTFYLTRRGGEELAGIDDNRAYFAFAPNFDQYTTLLPGSRMPEKGPVNSPGDPLELEAIVPAEAAELLEVAIGDPLSAVPTWPTEIPFVRVVVSGFFQRNDNEDEFSRLYQRALQADVSQTVRALPFFIAEGTFLEALRPAIDDDSSTYAWLLDVVPERLNDDNTLQAATDINATQEQISKDIGNFHLTTRLLRVFTEYDERLFFTRAPMLVFLILIAVVILYYVVTLASLLVEQQKGEIALLRSRGASPGQILAVFVLEGATISVLATAVGPVLAAIGISALGFAPMFSGLTGNSFMEVEISRNAYLMSAAGGALSFVALMIPAIQASRSSVTRHRVESARPSQRPFFHRYYLDLLLLAVGVLLLRQLDEQGSVLGRDLLGDVVVNELLLAIPGVMLIAAAMVLLRLFPLALSLTSRILGPWLPAGLAMGLWQMAREPTHYARLTLLLVLTASMGVFAASFVATLERSYQERVFYSTGSDVRVEGVRLDNSRFRATFVDRYERVSGIDDVSPAYRGRGTDATNPGNESFIVLGVDGATFGDVAWSRDDFAREPLAEMVEALGATIPRGGIELPRSAGFLSVTLKASTPEPEVYVSARVRDASDRYYTYRLGPLGTRDFLGNLNKPTMVELGTTLMTRPQSAEPLSLVSLGIHAVPGRERLPRGSVSIDQVATLTMRLVDGRATGDVDTAVLENFDSTGQWEILHVSPVAQSDDLHDGSDVENPGLAEFSWTSDDVRVTHGIVHGLQTPSLPVLASQSFLDSLGYASGDELLVSLSGHSVQVRLDDVVEFFPTMNPDRDNFLIADLTSLVRFANLDPIAGEFWVNEAWLSSANSGDDRLALVDRLKTSPYSSKYVDDREKRLADSQVDPLAKSGWSALLVIAFVAALVTSAVGFLVHAYVSARAREGQFALMRTMGFSMRQLVSLVLLEQVLLIAVGMALGTWMGGRLSKLIMPFLGHDSFGTKIVPPFVVEVDWAALAVAYSSMVILFALVIVGVIVFIRRIALQRILRMGEG
ncbi:MAG: FtsX-like permease family protein [SAR202 cluster bacterium]|jgi:ABC-type antimicrobial peptide transport system permease subunit|nr:FtsX-like permease family protein [SAR202 cluster bacterium]MDP6665612.1 FtsX-like permease family protein [SAR202 cluster bacterium]MDP6800801.1 FtsX-like permease family protein [SAR202 cluster bacterium]MQG56698.1 FtsX-like permease family protein [SAR202 cluster bacterium]MQG68144.1 FtsX-like permease family protein [SAR202 cluster bacterium]|tara:strand:- start:766 stop:4143 length:3378 start_codon:yes stop_codon:yes gene_type:complete